MDKLLITAMPVTNPLLLVMIITIRKVHGRPFLVFQQRVIKFLYVIERDVTSHNMRFDTTKNDNSMNYVKKITRPQNCSVL